MWIKSLQGLEVCLRILKLFIHFLSVIGIHQIMNQNISLFCPTISIINISISEGRVDILELLPFTSQNVIQKSESD